MAQATQPSEFACSVSGTHPYNRRSPPVLFPGLTHTAVGALLFCFRDSPIQPSGPACSVSGTHPYNRRGSPVLFLGLTLTTVGALQFCFWDSPIQPSVHPVLSVLPILLSRRPLISVSTPISQHLPAVTGFHLFYKYNTIHHPWSTSVLSFYIEILQNTVFVTYNLSIILQRADPYSQLKGTNFFLYLYIISSRLFLQSTGLITQWSD